jgi:phosphoglycerate dehydrogenase-like enzyme
MTNPHSAVLLLADTPNARELWTPEHETLAESLNIDVRRPQLPFAPESVQGAEAIITSWGSPRLDLPWLDAAPELKIVGHAAGSIKPIVSPELFDKGIRVVSVNDEMARCVAQWSLMMTQIAARNLLSYCNFGEHRRLQWRPVPGARGLHNLTIGIWGYGAISRELIRLLRSLGIGRILIASEYMNDEVAEADQLIRVSLDELFEQSDIVHLLTSLTPRSVGSVGAELLSKLSDGATLINSGRAHLVDETALMNELHSGRISACMDVFYQEPLPEDAEIRTLSNVVLTPHNAGTGSRDRFIPLVLQEFDRFFRGEKLQHEITATHAAAMTTEYRQIA